MRSFQKGFFSLAMCTFIFWLNEKALYIILNTYTHGTLNGKNYILISLASFTFAYFHGSHYPNTICTYSLHVNTGANGREYLFETIKMMHIIIYLSEKLKSFHI